MNSRSLTALFVAATSLVVPSAASAADLYVSGARGDTACTQADPCRFSHALALANAAADHDAIHVVGTLDYSGGELDLDNVDLIGSGSTALDLGSANLVIDPSSSLSGASVTAGGVIVDEGGTLSHDSIDTGITVSALNHNATTTVDHVDVTAPGHGVDTAGADTVISDSHIVAPWGIDASSASGDAVHVERSVIESSGFGLSVAVGPQAFVSDSLIEITADGGTGIYAGMAQATVDGSTIYTSHGGGSKGASTEYGTIAITSSIVRGFTTDIAGDLGPVGITDSDFVTTSGAVNDGGGNVSADPHWADFHLQADSPLIDRGGATTPGETDLDGNPRAIDGDGDGTAVRDMGAYEFQPPAPPAPPAPEAPPAQQEQQQQQSPDPVVTPPADQQPAPQPPPQPQSPAPTKPAAPAPLKVKLGRMVLNRRGLGTVSVSCTTNPCRVKLTVTAGKHRLATVSGHNGKIKIRLPLAYLEKHHIRRVTVDASATAGVRKATATRMFRVL